MLKLVFMRHGRVSSSARGDDPSLDKKWLDGVPEKARQLEGISPDYVMSGRSRRVSETAEWVCGKLELSIDSFDSRLDGMHGNEMTLLRELGEKLPEEYTALLFASGALIAPLRKIAEDGGGCEPEEGEIVAILYNSSTDEVKEVTV